MQGRALFWSAFVLSLTLLGCEENPSPEDSPLRPLADAGNTFDSAAAGTIRGQVLWNGDVPSVPPFLAPTSPLSEQIGSPRRVWPNPHRPKIHSDTGGVEGAVVFLRGISPRQARPWDHPPVRVEQQAFQFHVRQGNEEGLVGFVRRGDSVTLISLQEDFHALQARGAAFFTLVFPDPFQERTRQLDRRGLVTLSSNCGYFWMRAYLFVDDHPYYARTDAQGRFVLPAVPPGTYDLVCWLPNWNVQTRERDAETWQITRLTFRPPVEMVRPLRLERGGTETVRFELSAADFGDRSEASESSPK